jgi:hypothetical protein
MFGKKAENEEEKLKKKNNKNSSRIIKLFLCYEPIE